MKKYLLLLSVFFMTSCYEDYIKDFDKSIVYFTYQTDVRSFVVGENNSINLGAVLAGVMSNEDKRVVKFSKDVSLLNNETLTEMKEHKLSYISGSMEGVNQLMEIPEDWYSLSNNEEMVINKGKHSGIITMEMDMEKFLSNPELTKYSHYAIPLKIESADADSINSEKNYTVVGLKYECKLFGDFYHYGEWTTYDADGIEINREVLNFELPMQDNTVATFTTVEPYVVESNAVANVDGCKMFIKLNEDNSIDLTLTEEFKDKGYQIEKTGECSFNNPSLLQERLLTLNYKLINPDGTYVMASDYFKFRNRIRDGVNEWRDENPENYN